MPLTDRAIKGFSPTERDYKKHDEKGLYILIKKSGSKLFYLKYRFDGKEKKLAIGPYPEVTLKKAREKRDAARLLLLDDIDPSAHKKAQKLARRAATENSFATVALEWQATHQQDKSQSHRQRIKRCFERDLFPAFGTITINEISAHQVLDALRKIEARGTLETAHKTKQIASQVFRYAIATGRANRDPTPDLRGALKPTSTSHYAAITDPKDVGLLLIAIDNYQGTETVRAALKLSALFFCRPGELRSLEWDNVNTEQSRIELKAEKTNQDHIIPLSRQAIEILDDLRWITGDGRYIFPSARGPSRHMSENAIRVALRTMGYDNTQMTAHGFRAMARTLLDEVLNYRIEWIEQQLAHSVRDHTGRAYNRTKHLEQRTEMMQHWADYLDELRINANSPIKTTEHIS